MKESKKRRQRLTKTKLLRGEETPRNKESVRNSETLGDQEAGKEGRENQGNSPGTLWIVPTPIGNLEDITLRALRTLKEVDKIAAEDTRNTRKLLTHFEIHKPLISYHDHNEKQRSEGITADLEKGVSIALVSDAGMPGISDPGFEVIQRVIEKNLPLEILPGPAAFVNALVGSGLPNGRFVFEGFLSRERKERKKRLEALKEEERTMIFYESPHRMKESLKDMEEIFGPRQAAIARELTKRYEEFIRGSVTALIEGLEKAPLKGEMVLVVAGFRGKKEESFEGLSLEEHLLLLMETGLSKKDAVKKVAKDRGIPKREVYDVGIGFENPPADD